MKKSFSVYWKDIAEALEFDEPDSDEAREIIIGMLSGETLFTKEEVAAIAFHKGITVDQLFSYDEFKRYRDPAEVERERIAVRMVKKGFEIEVAADAAGITVETLQKLLDVQ